MQQIYKRKRQWMFYKVVNTQFLWLKGAIQGVLNLTLLPIIEQRSRFLWTRTPHTHTPKLIDKTLHTHLPCNKSSLITTDALKSKTCTFSRVKPDKRGQYSPFLASRARHPAGEKRASARKEKHKSWGTKIFPLRVSGPA